MRSSPFALEMKVESGKKKVKAAATAVQFEAMRKERVDFGSLGG